MKHLAEYRNPQLVHSLVDAIGQKVTRRWNIMEICGGQTHCIVRHGLEQLLPREINFLHGPGCPVCVTSVRRIDQAIELAMRNGVTLCSFGDMLRVPGSSCSLLQARAQGAAIELVYSPLDALELADSQPATQFVFFGVGFETTAPATAMAVREAARRRLDNFSVLAAHVAAPPAVEALLSDETHGIDGLLAAGHVCSITGLSEYEKIAERFALPIVATGFEPVDILQGVLLCVEQLESGRCQVLNQYERAVAAAGNAAASRAVAEVFEVCERMWRGIGPIAGSGLAVRERYGRYDAERRFELGCHPVVESSQCIAGLVLLGKKRPAQCPSFGAECTPERPLGAPMVSSEGACAAYYRFSARPDSAPLREAAQ